MDFEIQHSPAYAMLRADLASGDELVAESDAMISMDPAVSTETEMGGGFLSAVFRTFGGESFFVNRFAGPGTVSLAPTLPGQIKHRSLRNESLILQAGAFLASSLGISITAKWGGLQSLFGGEGAVLLEATGSGDVFYNAFGHVYEVDVRGSYTCDTGHMVAFDPSLNYRLTTAGGAVSTLFSGEGLIFEFEGTGKLYMQTRSLDGVVDWITPFLPD